MTLTIKKEAPIKYMLNMHMMESFLTLDSVSFEICKYLIHDIESNDKKDLTLDNLKFTSKTIKYIFGKKLSEDSFKDYIKDSIKQLISEGFLVTDNKSIHLTEKIITKFYKIN